MATFAAQLTQTEKDALSKGSTVSAVSLINAFRKGKKSLRKKSKR
tara:strand:+ start:258 stop:392 length:135 start_codon:yes stop_codon:yes gene_type:complete